PKSLALTSVKSSNFPSRKKAIPVVPFPSVQLPLGSIETTLFILSLLYFNMVYLTDVAYIDISKECDAMLFTVGALMTATSIFGLTATSRKARLKRSIRRYLEATKLSPHVKLRKCRQRGNCFITEFTLPYGLRIEKFQEHISGLEQATASKIRFRHLFGSTCELTFGFYPFHERMNYSDRLPKD